MKSRKIVNIHGKTIRVAVPERKSLKELIRYEISETQGIGKEEQKVLDKIIRLEEKLEETITFKEKKLLDEILNLWCELHYYEDNRFYDAFWEMICELK